MKYSIHEHKALKELLRKVYLEKEAFVPRDGWQQQTMKRIRGMGALKRGGDFWMGLEALAWRLSPVTCGLILALSILLFGSDYFHDNEILSLFSNGSEVLNLTQIFGLGA
ncbi:MAG: hypothetical protein ACOWYE_13985 [Desulfatiglandales bacterium]